MTDTPGPLGGHAWSDLTEEAPSTNAKGLHVLLAAASLTSPIKRTHPGKPDCRRIQLGLEPDTRLYSEPLNLMPPIMLMGLLGGMNST